jgi:tRNA(fMet)-specific endonuclease VapC
MTHRYMLDTNIVSHVLRWPSSNAASRFRAFQPGELCISVIVACELRFGAEKVGSDRLLRQIEAAATLYDVLPLDAGVAESYAKLRVALERAGTPIGPMDQLIAAHALSLGATLVTDNVREFSRVADLHVENWLD